jgi:hypothetical protein
MKWVFSKYPPGCFAGLVWAAAGPVGLRQGEVREGGSWAAAQGREIGFLLLSSLFLKTILFCIQILLHFEIHLKLQTFEMFEQLNLREIQTNT